MPNDENGNPIVADENDVVETEAGDEPDYKTLYEKSEAEKKKFEGRFKSTAKELNELKKSGEAPVNVEEVVSKKLGEEMFYMKNPVAKEFEKEIKEIQAKSGLSPEDAFTFYLAKNKPELLGKKAETGVDGVSKEVEQKKDPKDMTFEELRPEQKKRG